VKSAFEKKADSGLGERRIFLEGEERKRYEENFRQIDWGKKDLSHVKLRKKG
jgi:hypothetical protein